MKLTDEQIATLFAFIEKKNVDYYDVQIELVDHLATGIEEKLHDNPNLTFDNALKEVYQGFGIFGFSEFLQEKTLFVAQKIRKLYNQAIFSFFTFPKIIFTITLFSLFWLLNDILYEIWYMRFILSFLLLGMVVHIIVKKGRRTKIMRKKISEWHTHTLSSFAFTILVHNVLLQELLFKMLYEIMPFLLTITVLNLITLNYVIEKVHNQLSIEYPEVFV